MKVTVALRSIVAAATLAGLTALAGAPALASTAAATAQPPVVEITSVANALPGPATPIELPFIVTATASDPDGTVTRVEFYANGTLFGVDHGAPYEAKATDTKFVNTVTLTAVAYDNDGLSTTSAPVTVNVRPTKWGYQGVVTAGVEAGCLLLPVGNTTYLLIGGDRVNVLVPGNSVMVTGQERPDLVTTCMQGVPLLVSSAIKVPTS